MDLEIILKLPPLLVFFNEKRSNRIKRLVHHVENIGKHQLTYDMFAEVLRAFGTYSSTRRRKHIHDKVKHSFHNRQICPLEVFIVSAHILSCPRPPAPPPRPPQPQNNTHKSALTQTKDATAAAFAAGRPWFTLFKAPMHEVQLLVCCCIIEKDAKTDTE